MGLVFAIIFSIAAAFLFLLGWSSLDSICACAPLTQSVAKGVLGLFFVGGATAGVALHILCS